MKTTTDIGDLIQVCDFCGVSTLAPVSMFISAMNPAVCICKICVDAMPFTVGKVSVVVSRTGSSANVPAQG